MTEPVLEVTPVEFLTEAVAPAPVPVETDTRKPVPPKSGADKFIIKAKWLVVNNYNMHRNKSKTPALAPNLVHVVWFSQMTDSWKAILTSPVVRGMLYEVSYNGLTSEVQIDVYKIINDVKFIDRSAAP